MGHYICIYGVRFSWTAKVVDGSSTLAELSEEMKRLELAAW